MADAAPVYWSIRQLTESYRAGVLTPSEVVEDVLQRIARVDDELHAYVTVTADLAREQAAEATAAYRRGESGPLLGVPVSVKDVFHVRGVPTSLGSLVHEGQVAKADSGVVQRLRAAGAVFTGKTHTAEFGQSATTENLLGPDTGNPWDAGRTPGGSSGGAAASVAAGMASVAVGSDGGGSVRIPAAFCGLVGLKATVDRCLDERGFREMSDFVGPGPLAWRVCDARRVFGVLSGGDAGGVGRGEVGASGVKVAWAPRPEGRPVESGVSERVASVAGLLRSRGHEVGERDLPLSGWNEIFAPLVLEEEHRERGHLLSDPDRLTRYQRASLRGARDLDVGVVEAARGALREYRARIAALFDEVDVLLMPTTATAAFPLGQRPRSVDGESVGSLWGAFPFAAPFNVAGTPAITVPCGVVGGLPVGAQLVAASGREGLLLDLAEQVEAACGFDVSPVVRRWSGGC